MNHEKTFEAINKLKEVEIELHRLKNALEMTNRALETKDEQWGSSAITNPEFVAEQKEKTQQLRNMVDVQNMASKSTYKEQIETKEYERGFIDGMQKQMQSSVDKAVNSMGKREWVGLTDEEKAQFVVAYYPSNWDRKTAVSLMNDYEKYLKERNT